jgi:hypothetical protein
MTYIWIRCIATLGFTPFRPCSPAPIKANTVLLAVVIRVSNSSNCTKEHKWYLNNKEMSATNKATHLGIERISTGNNRKELVQTCILKNNLAKNDIFVISGYGPFIFIRPSKYGLIMAYRCFQTNNTVS